MDLLNSVKSVLAYARGPQPTEPAQASYRVERLDDASTNIRAQADAKGSDLRNADERSVPREKDRGTRLDLSV